MQHKRTYFQGQITQGKWLKQSYVIFFTMGLLTVLKGIMNHQKVNIEHGRFQTYFGPFFNEDLSVSYIFQCSENHDLGNTNQK